MNENIKGLDEYVEERLRRNRDIEAEEDERAAKADDECDCCRMQLSEILE